MKCPMCDEGELSTIYLDDTFTFEGKIVNLTNVESSVCDDCGMNLYTPRQHKILDERIQEGL